MAWWNKDKKETKLINLQYSTVKYPLPEFIYKKLHDYSSNANDYHPQPPELINKLSIKYNIETERIFLTAGIDDAIGLLNLTYGRHTYIFIPTFISYSEVEQVGGTLTKVDSLRGTEYQIDPSTKKGATLIYLANPNNPCGVTERSKVIELVKNNPQAIVVIDEAYADFGDISVIDEIRNYPNMVVCRSFSKAYGMAGNRIGFMVAHPHIINEISKRTQWANISYLSIGAAITALNNEIYFKSMREDIKNWREDFQKFLTGEGYTILPSRMNAVLVRFESDKDGEKFTEYLGKNNVRISNGNGNSNIGLDNSFVRISIGTETQMKIVKKIIRNYKRA